MKYCDICTYIIAYSAFVAVLFGYGNDIRGILLIVLAPLCLLKMIEWWQEMRANKGVCPDPDIIKRLAAYHNDNKNAYIIIALFALSVGSGVDSLFMQIIILVIVLMLVVELVCLRLLELRK